MTNLLTRTYIYLQVNNSKTELMVLDSHVHFWKYDNKRYEWIDDSMKMLQKDHLPFHLESTLRRNGVDGVVAVQAEQSEVETLFLAELAKTHTFIKGIVGWVELRDEKAAERLEYFTQFSSIKGYRHIAQGEPDNFFYDEHFRRGISLLEQYGLTYDILIYPHQLKAAIDLVGAFPQQPFILDHCGKPIIRDREIGKWEQDIQALASFQNVYCKLSGLFTEAKWKSWSVGDFYPYLDVVFKAFGPQRLVFGSDWPVMLVSGMYVQWKSLLEKYMENMLEEEKQAVFGGNCAEFYNL